MNYLESVENDKESGSESGGQSSNGTAMPILNRSPMNSKYVMIFPLITVTHLPHLSLTLKCFFAF